VNKPISVTAKLNSDDVNDSFYCVEFSHYFYDPMVQPLDVIVTRDDGRSERLTSRHEYTANTYNNLKVQVDTRSTALSFVAHMSWIGLKQIEVKPGKCDIPWQCTFEPGEPCSWEIQSSNDEYQFKVQQVDKSLFVTVAEDVTTDGQGHVLVAHNAGGIYETDNTIKDKQMTLFRSPPMAGGDDSHYCLTFYTFAASFRSDILEVRPYFVEQQQSGDAIWSNLHSNQVTNAFTWQKHQISLHAKSNIQLDLIAYNFHGSPIILDEIEVINKRCLQAPSCDFKNRNFCSYSASEDSDFRFLFSSKFPNSGTGLLGNLAEKHAEDLVANSEQFAFIDFRMATQVRNKRYSMKAEVEMTSGTFSRDEPTCLQIEYSYVAERADQGAFVVSFGDTYHSYLLFKDDTPGHYDSKWKLVEFSLPPGHNMFLELRFEAPVPNESPMLLLKDIRMLKGACESGLSRELVPEFTCTFNENTCAYLRTGNAPRWTHFDGSKPNTDLPAFDGNDGKCSEPKCHLLSSS
jgi:hypothetical protein